MLVGFGPCNKVWKLQIKLLKKNYLFRKMVPDLKQDSLDFSQSLVGPEHDATTGEKLHQREDHNHLLMRIVAG